MSDRKPHSKIGHHSRREALKRLTGSAGIAAGASMLPRRWVEPVVNSVILPAHAQLSTCCVEFCQLQTDNINVEVHTASLCNGIISISGGGGGPGAWSGSGPVSENGSFSFMVDPAISDPTPVAGTVSCTTLSGVWGTGINITGVVDCLASNCLLHGSLVVMASGRCQCIEELAVGDLVRSFATSASACEYAAVTSIKKHHLRESYYCINGELRITGDHPVLVQRDGRLTWIRVDGLTVGDQIRSPDGLIAVNSLAKHETPAVTVYVETSSGTFIARAGDVSYILKSTYATVDMPLEPWNKRIVSSV